MLRAVLLAGTTAAFLWGTLVSASHSTDLEEAIRQSNQTGIGRRLQQSSGFWSLVGTLSTAA